MFREKETELFALEQQFEDAAADPALSAGARYERMQDALARMQYVVMAGFRANPVLGAHLAELSLDYLMREDLAPTVISAAFARHAGGRIVTLHQENLRTELRRTVMRISNRAPVMHCAP